MRWVILIIVAFLANIQSTIQSSDDQKQVYFKKLFEFQKKMQEKVLGLKKINKKIIQNSQNLKGQLSLQKVVLQQGIKEEHHQLQLAFKQTIMSLKDKTLPCKNIPQSDKDLITQKILSLKNNIQKINNQLKSENNCWRNYELKSRLYFLKLQITSLQNQLAKTCEYAVKSQLISNLDAANNWIYGSQTRQNYKKKLNQFSKSKDVDKCPNLRPFFNTKQCIACQLPKYFNFQSNQCQICSQGSSFSITSQSCQKNTQTIFNSNLINAQNFIGKLPPYKSQYPQCPQSQRYFNSIKCTQCKQPNFWNFDKNQCRQCDKGLYFDKKARQCLYTLQNQKYKTNLAASQNIFFDENFEQVRKEIQNSKIKSICPFESPFFDKSSNECLECNGDTNIFNFLKNRCMKCPNETYFNVKYHICLQAEVKPSVQRMFMNSAIMI